MTNTRSERLNLYFEADAKRELQAAADAERVSLNEYIRQALSDRIRDQRRFGDNYRSVRALWERLDPKDLEHMLYTLAIDGGRGKDPKAYAATIGDCYVNPDGHVMTWTGTEWRDDGLYT